MSTQGKSSNEGLNTYKQQQNNWSCKDIQSKKMTVQLVNPIICSYGILNEAKTKHNFKNAEALLKELEHYMNEKKKSMNVSYILKDIHAFQRSITTIIRYASTPEQTLKHATHFFQTQQWSIRNASTELVIFTLLPQKGTQKAMDNASSILELALAQDVYQIDPKAYR